jgi:hypothetical protein
MDQKEPVMSANGNQKRGGHPKFYELGEQENDLYSAKHYQYATDSDPMSNFRLCGNLIRKMLKPGVDPTIAAALCLMSKQVVGIYEIVGEGKTDTIESLEDKLKDVGIYSRIIRILLQEGDSTPTPKKVEVLSGPWCENCEAVAKFRQDMGKHFRPLYWCESCATAKGVAEDSLTLMSNLRDGF